MNVTTANQPPSVFIGQSSLLFEGYADRLDWHQHSFVCVLVGLNAPFELSWGTQHRHCRIALIPAGCRHLLKFDNRRFLALYFAPHQRSFAQLMHTATREPRTTEWSDVWGEAIGAWQYQADPTLLKQCILNVWGTDPIQSLDVRILRVMRAFWEGKKLHDSTSELAAWLGLSASRLRYLVKRDVGSSLRPIRRGYRFWLAAHSMLKNDSFTSAAHAAEFADSAHFSRAFREAYGVAPSRLLWSQTQWSCCPDL